VSSLARAVSAVPRRLVSLYRLELPVDVAELLLPAARAAGIAPEPAPSLFVPAGPIGPVHPGGNFA